MASSRIPIIDLASPTAPTALVSAFQAIGFALLTNHGLPPSSLSAAFNMSAAWFALPASTKALAPHPPGFAVHRGYSSPGLEKVSDTSDMPDAKESYEVGSESNTEQPNVWPPLGVLPGWQEFMTDFYWECEAASKRVLRVLALGLGLDEGWFDANHSGHNNQLRLLHYPPLATVRVQRDEVGRCGPHTDWGSITLLWQDEVGGLEVEWPKDSGSFLSVPCVEGAVVVNIGDLMQFWSNDTLTSTKHRVDVPSNAGEVARPRYSIPYFVAPDPETMVECLPTCESESRPRRYSPIRQREWNLKRAATQY